LGFGGFAKVYLYINKETKKPVAVKVIEAIQDFFCGPNDIPESLIQEEIKNNIKLLQTHCVIPL